MKKASIASLLALLLALPVASLAAVPQTLAFSARIADNGRPVTGNHTVKFAIWDCDGTDPTTCLDPADVLWSETQTLTVSDGVATAVLGADITTPNPLPAGIFNGSPLFLQVTFDGAALSPRMQFHSVPYALVAGTLAGFVTPQTRYVSVGAGPCSYPSSPATTNLAREPLYCDLSDGVTNFTAFLPVSLPSGAVLRGFQIWAFASGTVTCTLWQGLDNFGTPVASVAKSGTGWAFSTETLITHNVDNTFGYAIQCTASGAASDNVVGTIRIRYTLASP
jgi:hypothetical protein